MNVTTMHNQAISNVNTKPIDKPSTVAELPTQALKSQESLATQAHISNEAKVGNFLANLSPKQQADVEAFVTQIHQQKSNGSFDAKAMAEQAPSSINELSAMLNVSTEELLDHIPAEAQPEVQASNIGQANASAVKTYQDVSYQS